MSRDGRPSGGKSVCLGCSCSASTESRNVAESVPLVQANGEKPKPTAATLNLNNYPPHPPTLPWSPPRAAYPWARRRSQSIVYTKRYERHVFQLFHPLCLKFCFEELARNTTVLIIECQSSDRVHLSFPTAATTNDIHWMTTHHDCYNAV